MPYRQNPAIQTPCSHHLSTARLREKLLLDIWSCFEKVIVCRHVQGRLQKEGKNLLRHIIILGMKSQDAKPRRKAINKSCCNLLHSMPFVFLTHAFITKTDHNSAWRRATAPVLGRFGFAFGSLDVLSPLQDEGVRLKVHGNFAAVVWHLVLLG